MAQHALVEIEMPPSVEQFKLPTGVNKRLQALLDRQDRGEKLTAIESDGHWRAASHASRKTLVPSSLISLVCSATATTS